MIYIIGNKLLDVCKIGFSDRPQTRIKSIQSGVPFDLEILSIQGGDRDKEKELHTLLESCRVRGEWFCLSRVTENLLYLDVNMIPFLSGFLISNNYEYISLSSLIKLINKERVLRGDQLFNISLFFKRDDIAILSEEMNKKRIKPIIDKGFGKWIHKYIVIEICRSSGAKEKLSALELYFEEITR